MKWKQNFGCAGAKAVSSWNSQILYRLEIKTFWVFIHMRPVVPVYPLSNSSDPASSSLTDGHRAEDQNHGGPSLATCRPVWASSLLTWAQLAGHCLRLAPPGRRLLAAAAQAGCTQLAGRAGSTQGQLVPMYPPGPVPASGWCICHSQSWLCMRSEIKLRTCQEHCFI